MTYSYDRRTSAYDWQRGYDAWKTRTPWDDEKEPPEPPWDSDIESDIDKLYTEALPKHFDTNFAKAFKEFDLGPNASYSLTIRSVSVKEKDRDREWTDDHWVASFEIPVTVELSLTLDKPLEVDTDVLAEGIIEALGMSLDDSVRGTRGVKEFTGMSYQPEEDVPDTKSVQLHGEKTTRPKLLLDLLFKGVGTGEDQGPGEPDFDDYDRD